MSLPRCTHRNHCFGRTQSCRTRKNTWTLGRGAADLSSSDANPDDKEVEDPELSRKVLRTLTREAMYVASRGFSYDVYLSNICRLELAGVVAGDKYHSKRFLAEAEYLGMQVVRAGLSVMLRNTLSGLGKPSRFAVFFDKVAIGGGLFSPHETLVLVGVAYADSMDASLQNRLASCPSGGLHGDGQSVMEEVMESLQAHPLRLSRRRLAAGLVGTGGDGQVVKGGPAARHKSTKAADLFWKHVHPNVPLDMSTWDLYHRLGVADLRSIKNFPMAQEVIDMHKVLNALFGISAGRILIRSIAAVEGHGGGVPGSTPVTREGVHAVRNAEDIVRHYALYHKGLSLRLDMSQRGQGSRGQGNLTDICRRFSAVDFVSFLLVFFDIGQRFQQPLNLRAQRVNEEGPEVQRAQDRCVRDLRALPGAITIVREWAARTLLLFPYLTGHEIGRLWRALRYVPDLRTVHS